MNMWVCRLAIFEVCQIHCQASLVIISIIISPEYRLYLDRVESSGMSETKKLVNVYFDIQADGKPLGRITMILRNDIAPKTVQNFRVLCTGQKGFGYKGSVFFRVVPGFMCQGGDIVNNNGSGGKSIYVTKHFEDENFTLKHDSAGIVSMANTGSNANGSQFFITTVPTPFLDGKHVVFGKVSSGFDVVKKIEALGSKSGKPAKKILIKECGEL